MAVAMLGAFYLGKDILYLGHLYKVVFTAWLSGIVFYVWADKLFIYYNNSLKQQIIDEIDSVVIEAPDLTDAEMELAVEGLGAQKGNKSDTRGDSDEDVG